MIINIDKLEIAALTFHMNIMRPSFRNIIKKNYPAKLKDYISSYDYVKCEATIALETQVDAYTLNLNIVDLDVLRAFLDAYINKSQTINDEAKSIEFQQHLDALHSVKIKADAVAAA